MAVVCLWDNSHDRIVTRAAKSVWRQRGFDRRGWRSLGFGILPTSASCGGCSVSERSNGRLQYAVQRDERRIAVDFAKVRRISRGPGAKVHRLFQPLCRGMGVQRNGLRSAAYLGSLGKWHATIRSRRTRCALVGKGTRKHFILRVRIPAGIRQRANSR